MQKNILFISHSAQLAGAERCLLELLSGLDRELYGGIVLAPANGSFQEAVESLGWELIVFPMPWWVGLYQRSRWHFQDAFLGMAKRIKSLRRLIKSRRINLVYTNTITCLDGALAAKLEGIPHIWHIHEILSQLDSLKFYVPKFILQRIVNFFATSVIVPSKVSANDFLYVEAAKIYVVPNGINLNKFRNIDSNLLNKMLSIDTHKKIICMVGNINENKRQIDFVEAAYLIRKKFKDAIFLIIGKGNAAYTNAVKVRIKELGLEENFFLLGQRDDIAEILTSVDILVSASKSECFPLVIIEGMAAGKPVVATMSGGSQEIIVHNVTGMLVPPSAPLKLAETISVVLADENRAKEMGCNGRIRAEALFSNEKYVEKIQRIIDRCLQDEKLS